MLFSHRTWLRQPGRAEIQHKGEWGRKDTLCFTFNKRRIYALQYCFILVRNNKDQNTITCRLCLIAVFASVLRFIVACEMEKKNASQDCRDASMAIFFANICKSYTHVVILSTLLYFWVALFALLSSASVWHAEAASVSGRDVPRSLRLPASLSRAAVKRRRDGARARPSRGVWSAPRRPQGADHTPCMFFKLWI